MRRLMLEVEVEDGGTDADVIDGVYHLPEVVRVVGMRFQQDAARPHRGMWARDESSRRPNDRDRSAQSDINR